MKRTALALLLCTVFFSASAQIFTAPDVRTISQTTKDTLTALRLTGTLTGNANSDFRQLREVCGRLAMLDMHAAQVTEIPPNAFFAAKQFKKVILPATLKRIGRYAFFRCTSLTGNLVLPEGLEAIDESAFQGCSQIEKLQIPSTLTRIAPWAFSHLTGMCDTLRIPEGVKAIGQGAFYADSRLKTLILPASLDTLAAEAFAKCLELKKIRLNSVVPPGISLSTFSDATYMHVKLDVPKGSEKAYRNHPVWRRFRHTGTPTDLTPANDVAIIPYPVKVERHEGAPLVWKTLPLLAGTDFLANEYERLHEILEEYTDYKKPKKSRQSNSCLNIDPNLDSDAYILDIDAQGLSIKGGSRTGIFYGIMTLRQLLISSTVDDDICRTTPPIHIEDHPRLAIRKLMIDPARTFIPLQNIEELIREMAYLKYNTLQLHLCDDQAWRIEIKAYPELTNLSSCRPAMDDMHRESAGYYKQSELKDLVEYARKWHVTLVPEIEIPGHQTAAFHAFPWLTCDSTKRLPIRTRSGVANELFCAGRESTYQFLETVFHEVCSIFPGPYIHLGGDEAGHPALGSWTNCKDCQQLAKKLGFELDGKNNWQLQEHMFGRIIDTLRTRYGKTPMFWYETDFHNIPEGCVTYAWRHGKTNLAIDAAIRNNTRILLCPGEFCYLDYPMAKNDLPDKNWGMHATPLEKVYSFDPTWGRGADFERHNLFGVAGTLWSECMPEAERIFYMAFPRAHALAEAAWSPQSVRDYKKFLKRLAIQRNDLSRRAVPWSDRY